MLVGGMVDDQFGDDAQAALLRLDDEALEVLHCTEVGMHRAVIGDVVTVIATGRRIKRHQPQRRDAQFLQIIELLGEADEIADSVLVAVRERLDVKLVDDRVLVPQRIG